MTAEAGLGRGGREHFSNARVGSALAVAVLVMAIIQIGMVVHGAVPVLDGILIDPDAYLRVVRVERLWETGIWYDPVIPRINPPTGFELHWTRPLDVLLLVGGWLASPFVGFHVGLFWWSVVFDPILQIVSVFAMVWAAAPILRRPWLCLLAILYVSQSGIFGMFLVGRPDHHGLLILLFIILIGFTVRMLLDPYREAAATCAGLVGALAIWVSPESMFPITLSIAALGLSWLLGEGRFARLLVRYGLTLLLGLLVALLIERGPAGLVSSQVDRISGAHILLYAVNLAFWTGMVFLKWRSARPLGATTRTAMALLAAAASVSTIWLLNPAFFAAPLSTGDALYLAKHAAHIQELQPLVDPNNIAGRSFFDIAARPLLWIGIAVLAYPWLLYTLGESHGPERRAWGYLALGATISLPMAMAQVRWAIHPELFLLIPYACFAGRMLDRLAIDLSRTALSVARPLLVAGLCVWFYLPTDFSKSNTQASASTQVAERCPINELAPVLNDPAGLGDRQRLILALIDFGPELLYRTHHAVLAIPNHRPQPGFTTSYRIMTATDWTEARRRIKRAGIDLVLICPGSADSWFYKIDGPGRTLYQALSGGEPPAFLEPVALPVPLSRQFRLFAVRRSAS